MSDDIMRRIAHIIDHEAFDGDGTLGRQVADRLVPELSEVWRNGYAAGASDEEGAAWGHLTRTDNPFNAYRAKAERQRAVLDVMDLEDELEAQERRHEL